MITGTVLQSVKVKKSPGGADTGLYLAAGVKLVADSQSYDQWLHLVTPYPGCWVSDGGGKYISVKIEPDPVPPPTEPPPIQPVVDLNLTVNGAQVGNVRINGVEYK